MRWPRLALVVLAASACGPIQSTRVLVDADAELRAAHRANAREQAPYAVARAETYLREAKEAKAHAEYQVAVRYGEKALACARAAMRAAEFNDASPADCPPPYAVPEEPPSARTATTTATATAAPASGGRP